MQLVGNDLVESGRYIKKVMGLDLSPEEIVEELLDGVVAQVEQAVPWRPGAVELLTSLRAAGVRCGLVTMSYQRFVAPILAHLPPESFSVVVTGEQVEQRQAAPRALPDRRRGTRRTARGVRGHRGLQHRRQVRRGGGLPRARRREPRAGARGTAPGVPDTLEGLTSRPAAASMTVTL